MDAHKKNRIVSLAVVIILAIVACSMIAHCQVKADSVKTVSTPVLAQAQIQQELNAVQQQAVGTQSEIYEKTENLKALINRIGELQLMLRQVGTVKIDTTGKR